MMKKTYFRPTIMVVKIDTVNMIAESSYDQSIPADEYSDGGTLTGSRGDGSWDDDE